ncbi:hypothetical protein ACIGBH_24605 [Streptomyces sp. NPDC085929]|uniref:hypothetical protein n=1 Tax=Streptomyces sp. NPDC085929 TaxID=3365739 RepID=UPI0037D0F236
MATRRSGPDHRVQLAALKVALVAETRARATAVAGTIRTDGTTVAAKLLVNAKGRGQRVDHAG